MRKIIVIVSAILCLAFFSSCRMIVPPTASPQLTQGLDLTDAYVLSTDEENSISQKALECIRALCTVDENSTGYEYLKFCDGIAVVPDNQSAVYKWAKENRTTTSFKQIENVTVIEISNDPELNYTEYASFETDINVHIVRTKFNFQKTDDQWQIRDVQTLID